MKILIAPYAAKLRNGSKNPKDYPYFESLVRLLNKEGYEVIQIGVQGEEPIAGVSQFLTGLTFRQIRDLVNECGLWISVDSFLQHFVHCEKLKLGIVLWGQSDPNIFGYPANINLLRGRDFLRPWAYDCWEAAQYNAQAFVYAENVIPHVVRLAPLPVVGRLAFA